MGWGKAQLQQGWQSSPHPIEGVQSGQRVLSRDQAPSLHTPPLSNPARPIHRAAPPAPIFGEETRPLLAGPRVGNSPQGLLRTRPARPSQVQPTSLSRRRLMTQGLLSKGQRAPSSASRDSAGLSPEARGSVSPCPAWNAMTKPPVPHTKPLAAALGLPWPRGWLHQAARPD